MKTITLALISRADSAGGGASRVADDIYNGIIKNENVIAKRFVNERVGSTDGINYQYIVTRKEKYYSITKRALNKIGYVDHFPIERIGLNLDIMASDIVHAHDISSAMAPAVLKWLAKRGKRVIWTLHDMSPVTAGCLYSLGCDKWQTECNACPQLGAWPLLTHTDRTPALHRKRLSVLEKGQVEIVTPSKWLGDIVTARIPNANVRVIHNAVNIAEFDYIPNNENNAEPTLVFIANHLNDLRKGALYLGEIAKYVNSKNINLSIKVVGRTRNIGVEKRGNLTIQYVGHLENRSAMNQIMSESHGLLFPSHADNFPLVVLEAMACGLPVFAFDTGGIREVVDDLTGYVAVPGAIENLIDAFLQVFHSYRIEEMRYTARKVIENKFTIERFNVDHAKLYGLMDQR